MSEASFEIGMNLRGKTMAKKKAKLQKHKKSDKHECHKKDPKAWYQPCVVCGRILA